jgi:hypothetical protein
MRKAKMSVNYDFWMKDIDSWTIQEALVLGLGYDPLFVTRGGLPDYIETILSSKSIEDYYENLLIKYKGIKPIGGIKSLIIWSRKIISGINEKTLKCRYNKRNNSVTVKNIDYISYALENGLPMTTELGSLSQNPSFRENKIPPYLDPEHKYYSKHLAVAVHAWNELFGNEKIDPYDPAVKKQIEAWVIKKYGGDETIMKNEALGRIATIVNPDKKGGRKPKVKVRNNPLIK